MHRSLLPHLCIAAAIILNAGMTTLADTAGGTSVGAAYATAHWHGLVDGNVPVDFHVTRMDDRIIEGTLHFGQQRFGFGNADALCTSATMAASITNGRYRYEINGRCGGRGTLELTTSVPPRLVGSGTLYDRSSAVAHRRKAFYMEPAESR